MSYTLEMLPQIITPVTSNSKFYLEFSDDPLNLLSQAINIFMRDTKIILRAIVCHGKNTGYKVTIGF